MPEDDPTIVEKMIHFLYHGDYSDDRIIDSPEVYQTQISSKAQKRETHFDDEAYRSTEQDFGIDHSSLVLNTQLYVIAEQYNIPELKDAAEAKYAELVASRWNNASFVASLKLMYSKTPASDRSLKEVALVAAGMHAEKLCDRDDFVVLCKKDGEICYDVLQASFKPQLESCPICGQHKFCEKQESKKNGTYYCYKCKRYFS